VYASLKRAGDVVLASILVVLTLPLALVAVALVKLTSRGPALYSQERLGRDRVRFRIRKIRTMTHECEKASGEVWAVRGDARIFPGGRVLRSLHIDELPQLINVLRGEMSLVGPRPARPSIASKLQHSIPGYKDRLAVRPGLTGLSQIQFAADTDLGSVCRKLVTDIRYARAVSLPLDLRILVATAVYLLHLPLSWRRRVLGTHAESVPIDDAPAPGPPGGLLGRLAAVYEIPQKPGRIAAVQGLRGVAATMVFLTHFLTLFGSYLGAGDTPLVRAVQAASRSGTYLFLTMSAFLIYGMCVRRPLDYRRFLRDRFWRIYPAFLCVFGLYVVLSAAFPSESKIPADPLAALAYLAENLALLPGLTGDPAMIVVTWTLGYELLLYATLPLAVRLLRMRDWSPSRRVAFLGAVWIGYLVYCGVVSPAVAPLGIYFAAFVAYEAVQGRRGRLSPWREAAALVAVAAGAAFVVLLREGAASALQVPGLKMMLRTASMSLAAFGVAYCCFGGKGVCARFLALTPLRWMGNMSYSFYLTHGLVLKALALLAVTLVPAEMRGTGLFWVALPLCFFGALAAATALFVAVEKPVSFSRGPAPGASPS